MARPSGKALNPAAFKDMADRLLPALSAAEIAEAAGISASTLSGLVSGVTRASNETAAALALVLRCDRATLFPEYVQFGPRPRAGADLAEVAS